MFAVAIRALKPSRNPATDWFCSDFAPLSAGQSQFWPGILNASDFPDTDTGYCCSESHSSSTAFANVHEATAAHQEIRKRQLPPAPTTPPYPTRHRDSSKNTAPHIFIIHPATNPQKNRRLIKSDTSIHRFIKISTTSQRFPIHRSIKISIFSCPMIREASGDLHPNFRISALSPSRNLLKLQKLAIFCALVTPIFAASLQL